MDKLDREIEEARLRRDEAKRLFEQLDIEVRVLERAASLRPSADRQQHHPVMMAPRRGGKPPGAINVVWRKVLAASDAFEAPKSPQTFFVEAARLGLETSLASVRDRLRFFESQGYLSGDQQTGYMVTAYAREKLGLDKLEGASTDISEEAP